MAVDGDEEHEEDDEEDEQGRGRQLGFGFFLPAERSETVKTRRQSLQKA